MKAYIATVQIVIPESAVRDGAPEDWFSVLLSENPEVFDWAYLKANGKLLTPTEIDLPNDYDPLENDFRRILW